MRARGSVLNCFLMCAFFILKTFCKIEKKKTKKHTHSHTKDMHKTKLAVHCLLVVPDTFILPFSNLCLFAKA